MKYEILFFMGPERRMGNQHTYQVEAANIGQAFGLLMDEWPNAIATMAKEGWSDITGHRVLHGGDKSKSDTLPVQDGPLAKRLKARQQKGWN